MKIQLCFYLFMLMNLAGYAQQTDSIAVQVNEFLRHVYQVERTDPHKSFSLYLEADGKFAHLKYSNVSVNLFYREYAEFLSRQGLSHRALAIINDLASHSDQSGDPAKYNALGILYTNIGDYEKAKHYDSLQLTMTPESNYAELIMVHHNLSDDYLSLREPDKAIAHLEIARRLYQPTDTFQFALYHHNTGVAYRLKNDYRSSEIHLLTGLALDKKVNTSVEIA